MACFRDADAHTTESPEPAVRKRTFSDIFESFSYFIMEMYVVCAHKNRLIRNQDRKEIQKLSTL